MDTKISLSECIGNKSFKKRKTISKISSRGRITFKDSQITCLYQNLLPLSLLALLHLLMLLEGLDLVYNKLSLLFTKKKSYLYCDFFLL
jgi:hypothetical protein